MVERWFEIRRKSIKQTTKRKFPTSASNTQSTNLAEEPKKPSRKRWAYSDEQNAGLQVAYDESRFLTNERTFALAIHFVLPFHRVQNWFRSCTRRRRAGLKQKRHEGNKQNQQSTSSSSVVALTSSHIHRQDPSQHDGNEPHYFDGNLINEIDQSNKLAPLDVYDVIHVLGDRQDDANEPI
ncbi:unnamed protein product [Clavelina lepadiformis]|uniref:Homeobox domain-containing protein n=1 Tax=Clavelina lepadiformis TaxID=159417 RepID=A0ABP0FML2_CLALP